MFRSIASALAFSFAVVTILVALWPGLLSAQEVGGTREIAPGWVRKNLGESPANVPGFEKVRIVEDTTQPGAALPGTVTMPVPMFCTILKGEMTYVVDGVERTYRAGDSYTCAVGQKFQGRNSGSETAVERMHWLLRAGEK